MDYIKIVPICPLIGKRCISDGITSDSLMYKRTVYPCLLWDGDAIYNGVSPEEPCRLKRAINKVLVDEIPDQQTDEPACVPWDTEEGDEHNGK